MAEDVPKQDSAPPEPPLPESTPMPLQSDALHASSAGDNPPLAADVAASAEADEVAGPPPPVADGPSDEALIKACPSLPALAQTVHHHTLPTYPYHHHQ